MNTSQDKIGGYLFSFAGGFFAFIGLGMLLWQFQAAYWPTTSGTLLKAEVAQVPAVSTRDRTLNNRDFYAPAVRYTYSVGNQVYEGETYKRMRSSSQSRSQEERKVNTLWEQQRSQGHIVVHYNPTTPSKSVLNVAPQPFGFVFFSFGLVFVFLGLGVASESTHRRLMFYALAFGNFLGGVVVGVVVSMVHSPLTWWVWTVWAVSLVMAYLLALLNPSGWAAKIDEWQAR